MTAIIRMNTPYGETTKLAPTKDAKTAKQMVSRFVREHDLGPVLWSEPQTCEGKTEIHSQCNQFRIFEL